VEFDAAIGPTICVGLAIPGDCPTLALSFGKICLMEGDADKEERLLDIVDELAMIGAAFPCGFADMLWEEFWAGLEDIWAVGRLGRPPGPTRGCWRAKPGCICSRDELAADPKIEFDDAKIGEEPTEATGKLPGAARAMTGPTTLPPGCPE